jgi:hypothetical protein
LGAREGRGGNGGRQSGKGSRGRRKVENMVCVNVKRRICIKAGGSSNHPGIIAVVKYCAKGGKPPPGSEPIGNVIRGGPVGIE